MVANTDGKTAASKPQDQIACFLFFKGMGTCLFWGKGGGGSKIGNVCNKKVQINSVG